MVASLEVTDAGREVMRAVLWSKKLRWLGPALWLNRFITTGLLPEPVRVQYGLPWGPRRDRFLWLLLRTGAFSYRLVPGRLRRAGVPLMLWRSRKRIARKAQRAGRPRTP
jgi:uncharacterized protein (DUF2236 family)